MTNNDKHPLHLKPVQRPAIIHLANGKSISATAGLVGVSRPTIGNWIRDDHFASELRKAEMEKSVQLAKKYQIADLIGFEVLRQILEDKNASNRDRIYAAIQIRKAARSLKEEVEFDRRLSVLEDQANEEEEDFEDEHAKRKRFKTPLNEVILPSDDE